MPDFIRQFIEALKPSGRVADIGAGKGKWSSVLRDEGFEVLAIEKKTPEVIPANIDWVTTNVKTWIDGLDANQIFDGFLLKNVIQFLPKEVILGQVLPGLKDNLQTGGVIAIETFTKAPDPDFKENTHTYYSLAELQDIFPSWKFIAAEEVEDRAKDMKGNERTFFLTRLIVQKPV